MTKDPFEMVDEMLKNADRLTGKELEWVEKIDRTVAGFHYVDFTPRQREVVESIYGKRFGGASHASPPGLARRPGAPPSGRWPGRPTEPAASYGSGMYGLTNLSTASSNVAQGILRTPSPSFLRYEAGCPGSVIGRNGMSRSPSTFARNAW